MVVDEKTAWIGLAYFVAGLAKGVVGQGFPAIVMAMLSVVMGPKTAVALMVLPTFVTNVWQALVGGALVSIVKRLWLMLTAVFVSAFGGVALMAASNPGVMGIVTGFMLCAYGTITIARPVFPSPGRHEIWLGPVLGTINGLLAGMTGSLAIPGVPFMQSLGFDKNTLIQGMGLLFTVGSLAALIALSGRQVLSSELALISAAGLVPALIGMWLGQLVRDRLSELAFRRALGISLVAVGAFVIWRAI